MFFHFLKYQTCYECNNIITPPSQPNVLNNTNNTNNNKNQNNSTYKQCPTCLKTFHPFCYKASPIPSTPVQCIYCNNFNKGICSICNNKLNPKTISLQCEICTMKYHIECIHDITLYDILNRDIYSDYFTDKQSKESKC